MKIIIAVIFLKGLISLPVLWQYTEGCSELNLTGYHKCIYIESDSQYVIYEGEFIDSKFNGQGIYTRYYEPYDPLTMFIRVFMRPRVVEVRHDIYLGGFNDSYMHGYGEHIWAEGHQYKGHFDKGNLHGQGEYKWASGDYYKGTFVQNQKQGFGLLITGGGDQLEGEFKNDYLHGKATYIWSDGSNYEGEFLHGHMHGFGMFTYADGSAERGEYNMGASIGEHYHFSPGNEQADYVITYDNGVKKEHYDYIFKIIIIGNGSCGKSSLLHHYLHGKSHKNISQTVGVEFASKMITIKDKKIKLQLWDTAGQERYRSVARTYYRGALGAVVVYDLTAPETFHAVSQWIKDARDYARPDISIIGCGNKADLEDARRITSQQSQRLFQEYSIQHFETSAVNGDNIELAFQTLAQSLVQRIENGLIDKDDLKPRLTTVSVKAQESAPQSSRCDC